MNDEWYEEPEELASFGTYPASQVDETLETFEINGEIVSDRLKQLFQKAAQNKGIKKEEPSKDDLGTALKSFILDLAKTIDYRDLAVLIDMKPDTLKDIMAEFGIKVPIESAKRWADIDVGSFKDISFCSRCQVQLNHHTFLVGINDCRKCFEENIRHWVKAGESINIEFNE